MMGLPYGEKITIVGRTMWTQSTSVTDGQTDGQNYDHKDPATQSVAQKSLKLELFPKTFMRCFTTMADSDLPSIRWTKCKMSYANCKIWPKLTTFCVNF